MCKLKDLYSILNKYYQLRKTERNGTLFKCTFLYRYRKPVFPPP